MVTPRLPVPLPADTIAVGGFGLAAAGVGPEGDSLGGYASAAVGASVAAPVAAAEGFRFELDAAAGSGVRGENLAAAGLCAGGRAWRVLDVDERWAVGGDLGACAFASLFAGTLTNPAAQLDVRGLVSFQLVDGFFVGARPGAIASFAARGDAYHIDVPLSLTKRFAWGHIGAEAGLAAHAGRPAMVSAGHVAAGLAFYL